MAPQERTHFLPWEGQQTGDTGEGCKVGRDPPPGDKGSVCKSPLTRDSVRDTENLLLCVNSLHFNIGILFKKSPPNKIALIRAFN